MDKQYYKEYYHLERSHWWFRARMEILEGLFVKHIASLGKTDLKILNVGVATGATTRMLEKYGQVTSLEYDKDCCEFLKSVVGLEVINGSLTELPFEADSFDVICAFDVIEHIENDQLALQEIYRTLKTNGFVYLAVPAFMSLWSNHDVVNHHYRRYVLPGLSALVENSKFKIVRKTYFNFILSPPVFLIRLLTKGFKKKETDSSSGSDFEFFKDKKLLNQLLYRIFKMEKLFLESNVSFPFGVSALLIGKKQPTQ